MLQIYTAAEERHGKSTEVGVGDNDCVEVGSGSVSARLKERAKQGFKLLTAY